MHAGGCSIYLTEGDPQELVLRATRGLRPEAVGRVRLRVGEGIVGAALETREAIAVPDTKLDERFRLFPETGEERFRSLAAVPLVIGELSLGVLSVQTARPHVFSEEELELLETISAQVASIVMNARLLDLAQRAGHVEPQPSDSQPLPLPAGTVLSGIASSPGVAMGPVHLQPRALNLAALRYQPAPTVRAEWRAVRRALRQTIRQLTDLRTAVGERLGQEFADVFTTHIMILEDQVFRERLESHVSEYADGARALREVLQEYSSIFAATSDPTIQDRATDIHDVLERVIVELVGVRQHNPPLRDGVIVVADWIAPSDFVLLETEKIAGMITARGGATSHASIFARSLEIPAVTGLPGLVERIRPTDRVIVDGLDGQVIVNPPLDLMEEYRQRAEGFRLMWGRFDELRHLPSCTLDGREIRLSANIGGLNDLDLAAHYGARGVGLFRTEILALSTRGFPDEDEQVRVYSDVAERVAPDAVCVRTFDLGGDKAFPGEGVQEQNPQLGWRSIRLLLDREEVFATQLRAILRANARGNLRILIPMLTSIEELDQTQAILRSQAEVLGLSKLPPLGVMIETPAAVAIADRIAKLVDFFAIGTNDLVQYVLAMDRENERIASSYDSFHPAVLAQIRQASDAARAAGIACSVCGELAAHPVAVPILIGMGITELSMTPFAVALVRQVVRALDTEKAERLARDVESCARASEVREILSRALVKMGLTEDRDLGPVVRRFLAPRGEAWGSTSR
jgi:phosphotransferase system enzyme I (PtsP)